MKASDSVNSLTELNPNEPPEKSCFICLEETHDSGEPLVDSKLLRTCGCKFFVHPACWNVWIQDKSDYDCPICRKDSMLRLKVPPNPVLVIHYHEEPRSSFQICKIPLLCAGVGVIAFLIASIVFWG
jgi:hypothetical protein